MKNMNAQVIMENKRRENDHLWGRFAWKTYRGDDF